MSNGLYSTQYDRDSSPGFLENLPSSIRRYSYEGREQVRRVMDLEFDHFQLSTCLLHSDHPQSHSDDNATEYVLFDIDSSTLEHDILNPNVERFPFRCSSFDITKGLLLVKMVTLEHSQAATAFHDAIFEALEPMNLHKAIQTFSGVTIKAGDGGKEPDHGWGPIRPPPGYARKPTIALEVAVSETPAKLQQDVDFWLDPNRGNANIVITLRVNRKKPLITIDKWERRNQQSQRVQQITIAEDPNGERVTVSAFPLILPFHLLFRRPRSSPAEVDIRIGQQELKGIAERIWAVQEF
ncbi:uncharacterized protein N7498_002199 [Penicillium cinerascens]|uniref:Uncharacterized protein n=1 Tax=Penicillium cinerascens TaxID=70096 RepID=A0A9W9TAP2_9EURO|nr:uncharacterized protein N7498_002199 [Penicillium cinerascens]KAJ5215792.1 hypothetical protein N7498_002199 [Penicillium cinerascens]